jgi:light-regulated signal transduction histidine kinase (bacteriophytochrome)
VTIGGREYGMASVTLSPAAMEAQLWTAMVDNAAILFLAWIAQAGLTLLVLRHSIRSLTRLDSAVRRIEAGDLSQRLAPDGPPEIGRLIAAFNGMSDALEAANRRSLNNLNNAEAAHRELRRFSEILTHHLQEPVRQIISFGRLLEQGGGEDLACLPQICEGATRLRGLLADIELYLALSHLPVAEASQSAERAAKAALVSLAPAIEASGAEISVGTLPMVWLDMRRLTILFKELIGNAVEYRTPDRRSRIRVSAMAEGDMARFSVEDNGIGIESRYFDRIFGVFNRLHTRAEHPGNGIGLAMVRKIVLAVGGQVEVKSETGIGTVFSFTLPLNQPIGSQL